MRTKNAEINRNLLRQCPVEIIDYTTDEESKRVLSFYKTCVLPADLNDLKEKLKDTIQLRRELIKKKETNFPELFPFYFASSDLILYDFQISFRQINADGLRQNWPLVEENILHLVEPTFEALSGNNNIQLDRFLILLNLLPAARTQYKTNLNKFVKYTNISGQK